MSIVTRALIAALLITIGVLVGAAYAGYLHVPAAAGPVGATGDGLASINLAGLLGSQAVDRQLVDLAYRQVEHVYYKPFEPQLLANGEQRGLQSYLSAAFKTKHVALRPMIPTPHGTDMHALEGELTYAQTHYARYLGSDGRDQLTEAALTGMLDALRDPYTVYLSPDQIRALNEQLDGGDFGGIGVFIYQLKSGEVIVQPIAGLPASRAGMHINEVVQTIDGQTVGGMSLDRVERLIRGPEGSVVTLTTRQYKQRAEHRYRITREIIHVPTVQAKMEGGYNYVRLSDFGETSAAEVRKALLAGKAHGAKGTILDLRDNGGGLLNAAVDISSLFLNKGVVVTEIDRYGNRDAQDATGDAIAGVTPLVILVNGYTASASEITAGALQDYKIATLIGTKTFGKGVVQGIFSMPNGGALKITTQRYVTPSGRDIQHKGIVPNITVAQAADMSIIDTPKDKQLQTAKAFLNRLTR